MRAGSLMWGALIIAVGISLFLVKYKVQGLEAQLAAKRAEIARDRGEIRVLDAEWTYLNDPERLRRLSEQYLGFRPAVPANVTEMSALPTRHDPSSAAPPPAASEDAPLNALPSAQPDAPAPAVTMPTAIPSTSSPITRAATESPAGYPVIFARLQRLLFPEAVGATILAGTTR